MRHKLPFKVAPFLPVFFSVLFEAYLSIDLKNTRIKRFSFAILFPLLFLTSVKNFAQVSESFDSGIPDSWTLFENIEGISQWQTTTDGYLGTNGVSVNPTLDNIGDQNTAEYFLVSPQITVPENAEIHFYTKQGSDTDFGTEYQVRVSTAAQPDINGFNIVLQSYDETNLNNGSQTEYEQKVIDLSTVPAGLNIYIALVAVNTQNGASPTGDEWFIDQFGVLEGCVEIEDSTVTIEDITIDGATVSWTHPTASNFEIQAFPSGSTPSGAGIPVDANNYTLNNLDEDTEYDIYIRSICDNNTYSDWSGPYTFQTLKLGLSCDDPIIIPDISSTPYVLADNLANWQNPEVVYSTQGSNCITGTSTANYLNGGKIFLSYTPTEDGLLNLTQTTFTGDPANNCYNDRSSLFVYEGCDNVGVNCTAGVITLDAFEPKTISNLLVEAGQTYIIVVSSQLSANAGICFELEISSPTCAPPADIIFNNLTEDSVNFSWDNIGGFADAWEYAVVAVGSGEPTGSGTSTSTNEDNLINTGLTPGTTYDFYVRSVCGGTPGIWSDPLTFTTQCTVFDTPYSTDFADATNANPEPCWTTLDLNGDGNQWAFIGGYATVNTDLSQYENHDMYVSPQINFDGVPKRLRYKHRATQGTSTYTIRLSTTGVGPDNFTTVVLPETQINNTGFQEIMLDLPEVTGNVNIAWIVEPNTTETAFRLSIDDVVIEDKPTCPDPINPFVLGSSITTTSAWLFWTAGEDETQWEVAIQDLDSGIPTGNGTLVDSNFPYMAEDLTPGNQYEFYVRAYCNEDDQSEWVGPIAFTTLCTSYDTPFFESFNDDDSDTQKFCWNTDNGNWTVSETKAEIPAGGPYNDYLISPAINIDGVKELKYKYKAEVGFFLGVVTPPRFGMEVLMSTTTPNPSSFSVIVPFETFTNSGYIEKSVIIEGDGPIYIAFRVPPAFSGQASTLNIDDVSITDAPACPIPSSLTVDTVTSTGAELSWSQGYQEEAWNIVVQPAGSGIPQEPGVSVDESSYSATNLAPGTEYEFYVMSDCGSDTSEWYGPVSFTTICSAFSVPFTETFNSDSESESCWTVIDDNYDLDTWELNSAAFPYEGDQAAAMFTGHNGQNEDWLISPTITLTENQRLRYYYRVNDSFFTEDLEVLLSTNGTGLDQFTNVLYDSDDDPIIINNVEYKVKIISLADYVGDVNIAFHVPYFASTGPYRGQTLVIDNVNIEDIPECPEITNVVLNNITDTQVQVSWDLDGPTPPWEISVQPAGTAAPIGDTNPAYLYEANSNPFTVTGLDPSTMYDIYVRSVCSDEDVWTGPVQVTTLCSFEDLCQYTFILTSDSDISSTLDITQNNQVTQSLDFNGNTEGESYNVFLCSGVEFSLYFYTIGSNAAQYANYQFEIIDAEGTSIYTSPLGMQPKTTVYTGTAICGDISCPQPTDLAVSPTGVLSWTPAGGESEWEVAIQSLENGTIPQAGTVVSTPSYSPTAADFIDANVATYEYFVRALCGEGDESYWSGPFVFVRNDDVSNALEVPVNSNEVCATSITEVSFINTSVSSESMTCEGENGGDVWFSFVAESPIHHIVANFTTGNYRESGGFPPYPEMIMTLYRENEDGSLEEIICSYDQVITAMYTSELTIGDTYKVRLTKIGQEPTEYRLSLCVTTPEDLCDVETINGGFELPFLYNLSGINTIITVNSVPGWRQNLETNNSVFVWESLNAPGFSPYEGGQLIQLRSDQGSTIDPNDPDIKGLYRDFDTSEITLMDFSFAHYGRFDGNNIQLYAGAPGGPYTLVTEHLGEHEWQIITGDYAVPNNQDTTRFIFRANGTDNIGNLLDAIHFVANNEIISENLLMECDTDEALVEANGTGTWIPNDNNPGMVTIADANSNTTTITDFVYPGTYTFTWQTRYCSYDLEITYNGIADIPTVETPIDYCLGADTQTLSASELEPYTLMWFTEAVGGTGSITAPTPDTSVIGTTTYYVAYTDDTGCEGPRAEIVVTVSDSFTPELTFSYDNTCVVADVNPLPTLSENFETGGLFSSGTLTVNETTGEIDMTTASVGIHDITYTYEGDEANCTLAGTYTATIEFTAAEAPIVTFSYDQASYCILSENILPTLDPNFVTGGSFSSETLGVNETTGEIDMTSATSGSHDVVYVVASNSATCMAEGTYTATIVIEEAVIPVSDFSYPNVVYCSDSANVLPELANGFTNGGTFTADSGLVIDPITGEINIAVSSTGSYTIAYEIAEDVANCMEAGLSMFEITVYETIDISISGACNDSDYWLTATSNNSELDADNATFVWMDANGNEVGNNSNTFNVTDYANDNPSLTAPTQFSVTVHYGDCSSTAYFTADQLFCTEAIIPRGISPDGNGKNDTFNLEGLGATNVLIFNRYGTEVYHFSGNYTNQWYGQTNKGDELPDGTYFYKIDKEDGTSVTGWVYINRAH